MRTRRPAGPAAAPGVPARVGVGTAGRDAGRVAVARGEEGLVLPLELAGRGEAGARAIERPPEDRVARRAPNPPAVQKLFAQ